jgi:hypothetical protein
LLALGLMPRVFGIFGINESAQAPDRCGIEGSRAGIRKHPQLQGNRWTRRRAERVAAGRRCSVRATRSAQALRNRPAGFTQPGRSSSPVMVSRSARESAGAAWLAGRCRPTRDPGPARPSASALRGGARCLRPPSPLARSGSARPRRRSSAVVELVERGRQVQLGLSFARALPAGVAECGNCDACVIRPGNSPFPPCAPGRVILSL